MENPSRLRKVTHRLVSYFWLLRPNRTPMVALITGAAAFAAGAGTARSLWMTLAGFCLAAGGFSLDYYADRDLDLEGVRAEMRRNPLAEEKLPLNAGLAFSISAILLSLVMIILFSPPSLIPWAVIVLVFLGLALHKLETPILRAVTLGLLQALYILMGALAGRLSPGLVLMALMFFFAMFAGRGLTDIRDYPLDMKTRVQTLPMRYGIPRVARFVLVGLVVAHAFGLGAWFTGEFNAWFLVLMLASTVVGLGCGVVFALRPTPRLAWVFTIVFMVGEGLGITAAMVLGSL